MTLAARRAPRVAPLLLGLGVLLAAPRPGLAGEEPTHVEKGGVAIDFSIDRPGGGDRPLQEGDHVEVRFRMTDLATGRPLTGVKPAAWLDIGAVIQDQAGGQRECKDKIGLYLKGIVGIRPMVDLNSSYLLVLNQDPSLSVIDPVVSMTGRTSLYATVILKRPPADWVLGAESKRLYVSMPQADEVAVVDAENFKLEASLEAGRHPVRVALQAEAGLLWVGNDAEAPAESGVTVLDLRTSKRLAHLATGRGHHELAFSADGRHAFVSNRDAGTVSVIEVARLRKVKDLATGPVPTRWPSRRSPGRSTWPTARPGRSRWWTRRSSRSWPGCRPARGSGRSGSPRTAAGPSRSTRPRTPSTCSTPPATGSPTPSR